MYSKYLATDLYEVNIALFRSRVIFFINVLGMTNLPYGVQFRILLRVELVTQTNQKRVLPRCYHRTKKALSTSKPHFGQLSLLKNIMHS